VISEHVTLRSRGRNMSGLCPFHDEKSPSFNVTPDTGYYHCFGCGVGGDVINFVMEIEHLPFAEAVERLAGRAGIQLRVVEGGPAPVRQTGQRQRLVAAHADAAAFYAEQLGTGPARTAREFLAARGFGRDAAERFGCGFAPDAWDPLTRHLRSKGYTGPELVTAGLALQARSGSLIDRFRRRLVWPIRDLSGDVIGFGARRLFDDDDGPKYLNTPDTPIYKKSHVLYGIDQAKREIAKQGRAVIVEGYTDVMACHLADVPVAVATCGTAFAADHIGVLRRILHDADARSEIIFTFDGDEAGQKAAMRAFEEDQRFVGQTFIAVSPDNMDPCELRMAKGDGSVRDLVARREPLIAFALHSLLARYDLDTAEGRVAALRRTAPIVAKIKDPSLRPEYTRKLAGDLGMELEPVQRAVSSALRGSDVAPAPRRPPPVDGPRHTVEREALKLALQAPVLAGPLFDAVDDAAYRDPAHVEIRRAVAAAGGVAATTGGPGWVDQVRDGCADLGSQSLVAELAVEPLRIDAQPDPRYVQFVLARLQGAAVQRRVAELKSRLQRLNPQTNADEYMRLFGELVALEQHARALREQTVGGGW
jgi:DNA primase